MMGGGGGGRGGGVASPDTVPFRCVCRRSASAGSGRELAKHALRIMRAREYSSRTRMLESVQSIQNTHTKNPARVPRVIAFCIACEHCILYGGCAPAFLERALFAIQFACVRCVALTLRARAYALCGRSVDQPTIRPSDVCNILCVASLRIYCPIMHMIKVYKVHGISGAIMVRLANGFYLLCMSEHKLVSGIRNPLVIRTDVFFGCA